MGHDSRDGDRDEPSINRATALRTDGGSEAEGEATDTSEGNDETNEAAESASESESTAESEEQTEADESESREESTEESEDHAETPEKPATIEADDEAVAEQTGDAGVDPQADESTPSLDGEGDTASIIEIRNQVIELSTDVIGRGLDGIIEVSRDEDNWRAVVEIIERRSVPDTQDILGQYEIELDEQGEVIGYRRLEKYRRADTGPSQH